MTSLTTPSVTQEFIAREDQWGAHNIVRSIW